MTPLFELKHLEELFRHKVFKMLFSKGKITEDFVDMLMKWRHSGFNVFCGHRIQPGQEGAMENLARYIIRASFSQERMYYIPEEAKAVYQSKDGKEEKIFDAIEWLAAMCRHVPNKGEQMVRYVGFYSNVSRGKRKKQDQESRYCEPGGIQSHRDDGSHPASRFPACKLEGQDGLPLFGSQVGDKQDFYCVKQCPLKPLS